MRPEVKEKRKVVLQSFQRPLCRASLDVRYAPPAGSCSVHRGMLEKGTLVASSRGDAAARTTQRSAEVFLETTVHVAPLAPALDDRCHILCELVRQVRLHYDRNGNRSGGEFLVEQGRFFRRNAPRKRGNGTCPIRNGAACSLC